MEKEKETLVSPREPIGGIVENSPRCGKDAGFSTAEKKCSKCGEVKPLSEFYRCSKSADGRGWMCKGCVRSANAAAYARRAEKAAAKPKPEPIQEPKPVEPPRTSGHGVSVSRMDLSCCNCGGGSEVVSVLMDGGATVDLCGDCRRWAHDRGYRLAWADSPAGYGSGHWEWQEQDGSTLCLLGGRKVKGPKQKKRFQFTEQVARTRVRCVETGIEYRSMTEAAIAAETGPKQVKESIKGGKPVGKHRWTFVRL